MLADALSASFTPTGKMGEYGLIVRVRDLSDDRAQCPRQASRLVLIEVGIFGIAHHIEVHRGVDLDRKVCLEFAFITCTQRRSAQKNADEGTGLGLPIVRGLVELHGGEFTLRSKVREGTEVIVAFPPERVMNALASLDPAAPSEAEIEAKRAERAKRWAKKQVSAA